MRGRGLKQISRGQRVILISGIVAVSVYFGIVFYRSGSLENEKNSSGEILQEVNKAVTEVVTNVGQEDSGLFLQDFHRVEVRDGKPVWEVKAKSARYFRTEDLALVNDLALIVYKAKETSVKIQANAAKLYLNTDALKRAELEGSITVDLDQTLQVKTEMATYRKDKNSVIAPGAVKIVGKGYEISGGKMRVSLENQVVELSDGVQSVFSQAEK